MRRGVLVGHERTPDPSDVSLASICPLPERMVEGMTTVVHNVSDRRVGSAGP